MIRKLLINLLFRVNVGSGASSVKWSFWRCKFLLWLLFYNRVGCFRSLFLLFILLAFWEWIAWVLDTLLIILSIRILATNLFRFIDLFLTVLNIDIKIFEVPDLLIFWLFIYLPFLIYNLFKFIAKYKY